MARFKYNPREFSLVDAGVYVAQVVGGKPGWTKGNADDPEQYPKLDLTLAIVPGGRRLFTTILFGGRGRFTLKRFCDSAELELPDCSAEISLCLEDCLYRIVYPKVIHKDDGHGSIRAEVKTLYSRDSALAIDKELGEIPLPANVPPRSKVTIVTSNILSMPQAAA
jgi:hypothetical protein